VLSKRLRLSLIGISIWALTGGCTAWAVNVVPPICLAGPNPQLSRLARCYEENCTALAVLRGDVPLEACRIKE